MKENLIACLKLVKLTMDISHRERQTQFHFHLESDTPKEMAKKYYMTLSSSSSVEKVVKQTLKMKESSLCDFP